MERSGLPHGTAALEQTRGKAKTVARTGTRGNRRLAFSSQVRLP